MLNHVFLLQINSIEGNQSDGGKFWNSFTAGESTETDSVISDSLSQAANSHMFQSSTSPTPHQQPHHSSSAERGSVTSPLPGHAPTYTGLGYAEITPGDSISVVDNTSTVSSHHNGTFSFKFNYGNKTHRFRHDGSNFKSLKEVIQQKIMVEHLSLSQSYVNVQGENEEEDWLTIAYLDDEDDQVLMTSDADLADSIQLARKSGLDRVRLFVHDAVAEAVAKDKEEKKEMNQSYALEQIPASQPTTEGYKMDVSSVETSKENLQELSEEEEEEVKKKRDISSEYNLPIPQEMLLPAAITFLGVVILGVFTISKLTSNNSRY
jgi:hypothetical protein